MLHARRPKLAPSLSRLLLVLVPAAGFAACGDINDVDTQRASGGDANAAGSNDGGTSARGGTAGAGTNQGGTTTSAAGMRAEAGTAEALGGQGGITGSSTAGAGAGSGGSATVAGSGTGGDSSAGTSAGGAGGGSAGAGGASGGTANGGAGGDAGGAGGTPPAPYCDDQVKATLPYTLTTGFQPTSWSSVTQISFAPNSTLCDTRYPAAVGYCFAWTYTPDAQNPTLAAFVGWSRVWDGAYTHPPVCLPAVTNVTFVAKGLAGGEVLYVSALGLPYVQYTLTTSWQPFTYAIDIANPNSVLDGVDNPFAWKAQSAGAETFAIDNVVLH